MLTELADGLPHRLPAQPGIQVCQLAQSNRGSPARFHVLCAQATRIVIQNVGRALLIISFQQQFHELPQVAGGHAGRLMRHQHAFFARLRHFRPEHAVQDVGVGLHQNPGLTHLVFLQLQNRAQRIHLPAHVLHHLVHGIHFDFAFLIALQSETDRHVLGRLHQQRRVLLVRRGFRRQAPEQLLQAQPRIRIGLNQILLDIFFFDARILLYLPEPGQQPDRLNHFLLLQRNNPSGPCRGRTRCRRPATFHRIGYAAQRNHRNSVGGPFATAARIRAFRGGDQLHQLLRIVQPLPELRSQGLSRNLRCNAYIAGQRIGRHKLHFINLDRASLSAGVQCFFDLL